MLRYVLPGGRFHRINFIHSGEGAKGVAHRSASLLNATQHGAMERAVAELGVIWVDQVGTRCGEPPHGRHLAGFGRHKECREGTSAHGHAIRPIRPLW